MQPFLTAFDSVCLYTIGVYCQQVYSSLIYTINLWLSLLRHGKADVSIALLIWLKRSLEKSPKGFGADSPKYGWVGSGGGRERVKVWAIRSGRRSRTDDGAGEEISNAGGCVHRLDTYFIKEECSGEALPGCAWNDHKERS